MQATRAQAVAQVLAHIESNRDALIHTLQDLIHFPTVNPPGGEREHQEHLASRLAGLGMEPRLVEAVAGRPNVVAVHHGLGGGRHLLQYAGHADVVDPGDRSLWRCDPFGGEVHDGWLYGRGAADHKASIAASLAALCALIECGVRLKGDVVFFVPVDEEQGSRAGTRHMVKTGLLYGDMGIYASGGFLHQALIACSGGLNLDIHVAGKHAHGAYPEHGINAIEKAAKLVLALQSMRFDKLNPWWDPRGTDIVSPTRTGTLVVNGIRGGGAGGVPDECVVTVERRLIPNETVAEAREQIDQVLAGLAAADPQFRFSVDVTAAVAGIDTAPDAPVVRVVAGAIRQLGYEPVVGGSSGGFDARWIVDALGIPMVSYGAGWNGPDGKFCLHTPNECIRVDELVGMAKGYALIMMDACGIAGTPE